MASRNATLRMLKTSRGPLLAALIVLVFSGVLLGYANSGKTRVMDRTQPVTAGVNVALDLVAIDTVVGLIVFLVVAMACLAAAVAWSVATERRPVEPTFAGWFAAMLFALIPLQNFLPGAPPVGAWIDVCVFLWVEVVLLTSMGVFVLSWFRFRGRPDYSTLVRRKQRETEQRHRDA
ncbi:MAG: DUF4436 family protein [Mycobacterium sp.]|nr:DUF4436 family protein [Mycobacterium sp.]